jgi:hypothetical protein
MNLTSSTPGREYNYPFKLCKQTLVPSLVGLLVMAAVAKVIRFFPFFTLFGLLTLALSLVVQVMDPEVRDSSFGQILINVLRVIAIPRWLMTTVVVIIGGVLFGFSGGSFPIWYDILTIPVLLLPYILADVLLAKIRGAKSRVSVDQKTRDSY